MSEWAQRLGLPVGRDAYEVLQVRSDAHQAVIRAAYRTLASLYHPDSDHRTDATARMAELNDAYARIRTAELRAVYDRLRRSAEAPTMTTIVPQPAPARSGSSRAAPADVIDFGRYRGWSIRDLARRDPDYLRWLSRHSSGIRFRHRITEALAVPRRA